jgi:hypothetical protein
MSEVSCSGFVSTGEDLTDTLVHVFEVFRRQTTHIWRKRDYDQYVLQSVVRALRQRERTAKVCVDYSQRLRLRLVRTYL